MIKAIANKTKCKPTTGKSYKVSPHTCNMLHDNTGATTRGAQELTTLSRKHTHALRVLVFGF